MYNNCIKILLLFLLISSTTYAQNYNRGGRNQGGREQSIIPRTNTKPNAKDREKEFQEILEKHIQNFIDKLEVDEFQKHIIKQRLDSYYIEKLLLLKSGIKNRDELEEKIKNLDNTHFYDLNEMTSVNIQDSIQKFIKTKIKETNNRNKKKRKKKKKDN